MNLLASKKTSLAATGVALRAIRDSADAFPPLKSTAAGMLIVWGAIEVSEVLSLLLHVLYMTPALGY
jgi:hypothetical protein